MRRRGYTCMYWLHALYVGQWIMECINTGNNTMAARSSTSVSATDTYASATSRAKEDENRDSSSYRSPTIIFLSAIIILFLKYGKTSKLHEKLLKRFTCTWQLCGVVMKNVS